MPVRISSSRALPARCCPEGAIAFCMKAPIKSPKFAIVSLLS